MTESEQEVKLSPAAVAAMLTADFKVSPAEADRLVRIVRINLKSLIQAMREAAERRQWALLSELNHKLEALAVNLRWQGLQKFCSFFRETVDRQHQTNLDALIKKLPVLAAKVFPPSDRDQSAPSPS